MTPDNSWINDWTHTDDRDPSPFWDDPGYSGAHRCCADRPPVDETTWMRAGMIRDTGGTYYHSHNGQPVDDSPRPVYP